MPYGVFIDFDFRKTENPNLTYLGQTRGILLKPRIVRSGYRVVFKKHFPVKFIEYDYARHEMRVMWR